MLYRCPLCRKQIFRHIQHLKQDCRVAGRIALVGVLICGLALWFGR